MFATAADHDTALALAADLRAAFPGVPSAGGHDIGSIEQLVDAALIDLSRVCLSHTASTSGPNADSVFQHARDLIDQAGTPAPAFEVLHQDATSARVRAASGREYGLAFRAGLWHRGDKSAAAMADAMRGAL